MNSIQTLSIAAFGPNSSASDERIAQWMANRNYTQAQEDGFRQAWERGYFDASQDAGGSMKPFYAFQMFSSMNDWPVLLVEPRQKYAWFTVDLRFPYTELFWKLDDSAVSQIAGVLKRAKCEGVSSGSMSVRAWHIPLERVPDAASKVRSLLLECWTKRHPFEDAA